VSLPPRTPSTDRVDVADLAAVSRAWAISGAAGSSAPHPISDMRTLPAIQSAADPAGTGCEADATAAQFV